MEPVKKDRLMNDNSKEKKAGGKAGQTVKGAVGIKPDFFILFIFTMGIFVLFVTGWGICQRVRNLNTAEQVSVRADSQKVKKIENNSENAGKSIDIEALIKQVLEKVSFDAELKRLDDSVAEGMVETTEGTKLQMYVGNGTYADALIVMTAQNENDAGRNQEMVKEYLSETMKAFEAYIPKEAKKVGQAVSIRCGCYVIVCITSDIEKAEDTINAFIQKK